MNYFIINTSKAIDTLKGLPLNFALCTLEKEKTKVVAEYKGGFIEIEPKYYEGALVPFIITEEVLMQTPVFTGVSLNTGLVSLMKLRSDDIAQATKIFCDVAPFLDKGTQENILNYIKVEYGA